MKEIKDKCIAKLSDGTETPVIFSISEDDETNKIRGGKLKVRIIYPYYADTLMEDYKSFLDGQRLCIDGGSNLCVENMAEIIDFIIVNRGEIETKLRGFNFDDKPPNGVQYG